MSSGNENLLPYRTVSNDSETEFVEKRSRFIGRCFHVENEDQALEYLDAIRRDNWDASHNCYAYIIQNGGTRYSDDGEPAGTAGLPILERMEHARLSNTLIVVTRYFGGILLGTGGLRRAYSRSAFDALQDAGIVAMEPCRSFSIQCSYSYWDSVRKVCTQFGRIDETSFAADVTCICWIKHTKCDLFVKSITSATEGRVTPNYLRTDYFPFPVSEDLNE